jgi:Fic family protein
MLNISYTFSPALIRSYEKINNLRREIILYSLSPKRELLFRFNASMRRIHYGLGLSGRQVSIEKAQTILRSQVYLSTQLAKEENENNSLEQKVLRYKQGFDYLGENWLVSAESITPETIEALHNILTDAKLKVPEKRISEILDYLQASSDSPFIQAALAKLLFNHLDPFSETKELLSSLCAYLFLYKSGWDFRGMLVIEEALMKHQETYTGQYNLAVTSLNVTGWIEYFVQAITTELENTYASLSDQNADQNKPLDKSWELNDRQKQILHLLDDPTVTITNRTVQNIFKVSQITASRDLAKLMSLGLLFAHGKGRSVRYTKV